MEKNSRKALPELGMAAGTRSERPPACDPPPNEPIPEEAGLVGVGNSFKKYVMCMGVLPACISVYIVYMRGTHRHQEESLRSQGSVVIDSYELPRGCWRSSQCS